MLSHLHHIYEYHLNPKRVVLQTELIDQMRCGMCTLGMRYAICHDIAPKTSHGSHKYTHIS
jgi:hypothetical protein